MIPIAAGSITADDVVGDFYVMAQQTVGRESTDETTVFKTGGGAHLDLVTVKVILSAAI